MWIHVIKQIFIKLPYKWKINIAELVESVSHMTFFFFFNTFCLSFFHFKACWCVFQEGIWTWKGSCTSGNLTYIVDVIRYLMQEMWIKIIQSLMLAILLFIIVYKLKILCVESRENHTRLFTRWIAIFYIPQTQLWRFLRSG